MTAKAISFYVVDYLLSLSSSVLDGFSDTDPTMGRMVYRDALPVRLKGTGKRAVVVQESPTSYLGLASSYGASVGLLCYADHTLEPGGGQPLEDGSDRAFAAWGLVDNLFVRVEPLRQGDPFLQSNRMSSPLRTHDPDQDVPYVVAYYDVAAMVAP